MRLTLLCLVLVLGGCAGPRGTEAPHPVFDDLRVAPLNQPRVVAARGQSGPGKLSLPPGSGPALVVGRQDRPFDGELEAEAEIQIKPGEIVARLAADDDVRVLFRLPPGLGLPATVQPGKHPVKLRERSGPAGADRAVVIGGGRGLVLAETWQTGAGPIDWEVTEGVRLVQSSVAGKEGTLVRAPLSLTDGNKVLGEVPLGTATRIETPAGRLVVYAQISHRQIVPPGQDATTDRYILRAWVTPDKR